MSSHSFEKKMLMKMRYAEEKMG